jgi:uncharacterized membrane protein/mono/diheme cytochrome c family protein
MFDLIGRLHPLLVHLPIGILLLAILFEWLPTRKKYRYLKRSIHPILLVGSGAAIFSCLTGYMLSQSGEYESGIVGWHQWMGISLTVYSLGYAWMRSEKSFKSFHKIFSAVLLVLLMITGHLGGSLTHGEDYLTAGLASSSSIDVSKVNLQEAVFYDDLVKPILEDKCYGCHGTSKQKGKLRLDDAEHILKGGKGGVVIVAGKTDESEMIDRMLLPLDDEDHMPPKEKKQLNEKEIEILKTWIASGADFKKSVKDAGQLAALEKIISSEKIVSISDIPSAEIQPADQIALNELQKMGVVIIPVATNSNYLSANLINATSLDSAIDLLNKVKEQLVWLKAGDQPVTDSHLIKISMLTKLTRINLDHAQITDAGLANLKSLTSLIYLNLNNTKISAAGISNLSSLKLQSLYLYGTNIKAEEVASAKKVLPGTNIEIGNLQVPFLVSDTTEAKAPRTK